MGVNMENQSRTGRRINFKEILKSQFPIADWLPNYSKANFTGDLVAGVTVSLTMVPESVAYAGLAALDPQYGLNTAFMGCFVYLFLGLNKEIILGPSSLMSLCTYHYTKHLNVDFAVLLCFITGLVSFLLRVLRIGYLVGYISTPVVSGFTSASALIIMVAQFKGLFGLKFESDQFTENIYLLYENRSDIRLWDAILGFISIVCLVSLGFLNSETIQRKIAKTNHLRTTFWMMSISRNFLAVFLSSCLSAVFKANGRPPPYMTTKSIDSGIPAMRFPPTSTQVGNVTFTFTEMVNELGTGVIVTPVIGIIISIAIAKAYATSQVDANHEITAFSLANMAGSFFQSLPTSGALTRSAIVTASGVETPLVNLYAGLFTLFALQFIGPYFYLVPRSSLAAVLIVAVSDLIELRMLLLLWRTNKWDFGAFTSTLILCLVTTIEKGLIFGIAISVASLTYKWSKPEIKIDRQHGKSHYGSYINLKPEQSLYFPSVNHLTALMDSVTDENQSDGLSKTPIAIHNSNVHQTDYTVAKAISQISRTLEKKGQTVAFVDFPQKSKKILMKLGCEERQFCSSENFDVFLQRIKRKPEEEITATATDTK